MSLCKSTSQTVSTVCVCVSAFLQQVHFLSAQMEKWTLDKLSTDKRTARGTHYFSIFSSGFLRTIVFLAQPILLFRRWF